MISESLFLVKYKGQSFTFQLQGLFGDRYHELF